MIKHLKITFLFLIVFGTLSGQDKKEWEDPAVFNINRTAPHANFIPFENESVKKNIANKVIEFFIFVFELKNGFQIYIKAKVFQYCFFMLEKVLCISLIILSSIYCNNNSMI